MRTAGSPPLGISGYSVLGGKTSGAAYIHLGEKRRSTECVKACVEQSVGVSLVDPSSMNITQVAEVDMNPQIVACCLTWCPIRYLWEDQ